MANKSVKECQFCGEEFVAGDGVPEGEFGCCCSEECLENLKYEN